MGRLRDRRRGGGPSRTLTGLTRTGTGNKVVGNKGGIQFPIVGECDAGEIVEVFHDSDDPKVVDLPKDRVTGVFLMSASSYSDDTPLPEEDANVGEYWWRWVTGSSKLAVWTNNVNCYYKFWVF